MNLKLEIEFSKAEVFKQVDGLKKQIDDMRPLKPDVEGRVMQKLRLDWNYNSNAIEGNKLSYGETTALLMHGMTAKGKPLKDHLDIQGHNVAIDLLLRMVQDERPLTEADVRGLHEVILGEPRTTAAQTADGTPTIKTITVGEYKNLPNHVKTITGEIHYYASPEETPAKMQELMEWYNEASANTEIHPIVVAALFHHHFVAIHPFDDGNGRMSRILMNLILMRNGYPVAVIKNDNKDEYYSLLSRADVGDVFPFVEYIIEKVESSLRLYLKAIEGGNIDEDGDIDKEIALLNIELKSDAVAKKTKSREVIIETFEHQLFPLALKIANKLSVLESSFFNNQKYIEFTFETLFLNHPVIETSLETLAAENLNIYIDILNKIKNDYQRIKFAFIYDNYKSPSNTISVKCLLDVIFNINSYEVNDINGNRLLYKLYHENITDTDYTNVVKHFMSIFKMALKQKA